MRTISFLYERFLNVLGIIPGVLAGIMALGVALEVILRNFGISALGWVTEAVEYGLLAVAMIGTAYLYRIGGHVTVDLVTSNLPAGLKKQALVFSAALSFLVSAVLFVYGLGATIESFEANVTHFKSFSLPEWIPLSLIPFAGFLLSVETARHIWMILTGRTPPVSRQEDI
jgi:C4-dicarboxylate transporter, DctQ subunit